MAATARCPEWRTSPRGSAWTSCARPTPKDAVRATSLQAQVTELTRVYEQGHWLPALKGACAQLGLGNGRPAPPLEPAGDAARAAIAALLARARLARLD